MSVIGTMKYLTIGNSTYEIPEGTVISIGLTNATNGGLTISGGPITSSGSITVGHTNVLTSAQTTQAVYPIKIDKNGHISEYGSAVTIPVNRVISVAEGQNAGNIRVGTVGNDGTASYTDVPVKNLKTVATSGSYNDLTDKPAIPTVPTNVSAFTNDAGYLTSYTETDPTVPSWAKASSKPSYTAAEVGAVPTTRTVNGKALSADITLSASDVSALPSSTVIPTITDTYSGTSSNGMSGKAVKSAIDALDGTVTGTAGAGKTLTAFSQTDGKVSATFGNISITKSQISDFPTIPTKVSDLTNDSGFITGYTETDPIFVASAAHGITSSDISNWNSIVSDDKTWNGVTLEKNTTYGSDFYVPNFSSTSASSAKLTYVTATPAAGRIPRYDSSAHMNSTDMTSQEVDDFIDGLDYSSTITADYIVSQGSDGTWTYRKWNSGICEAWAKISINTLSSWTASGNLYRAGPVTQNMPINLFVDIPTVSATHQHAGIASMSITDVSNDSLNFYFFRGSTTSASNVGVHLYCIGQWK